MSGLRLGVVEQSWKHGHRDALHVPVVLVTSDDDVSPGDNVRFTDNTFTKVVTSSKKKRHAVVDPFSTDNLDGTFMVLICPEFTTNPVHHFDINIKDVDVVEEGLPVPGITLSEHSQEVGKLKDQIKILEGQLEATESQVRDLIDKQTDYNYDDGCRGCYDS